MKSKLGSAGRSDSTRLPLQHPQKSQEIAAAGTSGSEGKGRRPERIGETPGFAGLYHPPSPSLPPSCRCPLPQNTTLLRGWRFNLWNREHQAQLRTGPVTKRMGKMTCVVLTGSCGGQPFSLSPQNTGRQVFDPCRGCRKLLLRGIR